MNYKALTNVSVFLILGIVLTISGGESEPVAEVSFPARPSYERISQNEERWSYATTAPPATTTTVQRASRSSRTVPSTTKPAAVRSVKTQDDLIPYSDPLPEPWQCIHENEAVNWHEKSNPKYRGGFQMGYWEWGRVGGVGDPADASPEEQFMRAQMYKNLTSFEVWSVHARCGV